MIMTIVPGSVTVAAGTATWASTLATATAVPGSRPVQAAASAESPPARSPTWRRSRRIFVVDDVGEGRVERAEVGRVGEAVALRPHRLVAGGARVPRLDPGQLPDDPVGRLDAGGPRRRRPRAPRRGSGAPSRRTTPTRSSRRSGPARPARSPRATSLIRSASGCAAWCFQSLTQACGFERKAGSIESGGAVGGRRQHRAGGEVDPDADDVGGVHAGLADHRRDRGLEHVAGSRRGPGAPSPAAGPRPRPGTGSRSSMTPLRYGVTAVASCRPSATSTSTARPDSVPKSTPIAYLRHRLAGPLAASR